MNCFKTKLFAAIAFAVALGLFIAAGCTAPKTAPTTAAATESSAPLAPGPNDTQIAYWTARLLEEGHYSQQVLNKTMSEKFFDGYLETLDPSRENFLQSDIDGFAHYRTNLDRLTVGGNSRDNLTPAYDIFERLLERLQQHTDYVNQLLKQDRFTFNTDDRFAPDRRHAPYPKDLAEAKTLWRQRLRSEYLQEKLGREFSPTNGGTVLPLLKSASAEITSQLAQRYNWTIHTLTNWDSANVLQVYLNALTHAYDPHTDYLNQEHAADFRISMSLQLGGIGAQLREDFGYCTIESLIPGGPAATNGQIRINDRIIAVAQTNQPPVNVVDMELPKVVDLIRGPKGTQVRLTIEAKDDPASRRVVFLTRDIIKLEDQEAKARLIELPDGHGGTNRIGVIGVPSFYAPVGSDAHNYISADTAKLIKKLEQENVAGIILDMRNNPGGSLEEAIRFTGLFIKKGPIVLARNTVGQVQVDSIDDSPTLYSGPLVVLINRFSASAAEIAAAALQDYGRALVVGDISTHGKGTVQNLTHLDTFLRPATPNATNDPGTLKITISKFYRVTGASTQLRGVVPDIVLPDVLNFSSDIGETNLENALPWDILPPDSISKIHYDKLNLVQPYLADVRRRSEARTATNEDFNFIQQDIEEFKKVQAEKTATLNEAQALKEREARQTFLNAHEQERASRKPLDEIIYDLTVENANDPGLPPQETNAVAGSLIESGKTPAPGAPRKIPTVIGSDATEFQRAEAARLEEAEHILEDYISLLSKNGSLIANQ
jgi:carboxyl-terminal processing protease